MSPSSVRDLLEAVQASHSIVHAVDGGTLRSRNANRPPDLGRQSDVLEALVHRTHGAYERGVDSPVYSSGLESVRRQLDGEVIVEYAVPPSAPRDLRLGLRLPGTLARAIALDHVP
jgi:hypothetical protein